MKKSFTGLLAVFVMLFAFIGTVSAAEATVPKKMYKAVNKTLKEAHYDYDNGSLTLKHVKRAQLNKPVENMSTLIMAVAQYNTVRDNIFYTTHRDIVYYSPDTGKVVPPEVAGKTDVAVNYGAQYENVTGESVHVLNVLILLFLVLLIPAIFIYIWAKRQHSVISYKLDNDLFDEIGDKKYS
ncbi:MAG TPA: hypothetical protein VFK33_11415 [Bacillales bacterium]|nr:hypothetical protein [Bacillales bacterium]